MELDRCGTGKLNLPLMLLQGRLPSLPAYIKVKEGTEKRGAIESVVRIVRKTVSPANLSRSPTYSLIHDILSS